MRQDHAQKIWDCIKAYRQSQTAQIRREFGKKYVTSELVEKKIVESLEKYPGRHNNHGHVSGRRGDRPNPGSEQNLNIAIQFLLDFIEKNLKTEKQG